MGWLWRRREPIYSPEGQEVYRLLTEDTAGWVRIGYKHARHTATGIACDVWGDRTSIYANGVKVSGTLTPDDLSRIQPVVARLVSEMEEAFDLGAGERERQAIRQALNIAPPPPTLDATAVELARAVLKGDLVAARALADRVQELSQEDV